MYHKPEFAPRSRDDIERVIREHPFAMLITMRDGEPLISHLPFVYSPGVGEYGSLVSHLAAGNPQARDIRDGASATVAFRGVHGYISPSWLSERTHTAPTWNYEAVECRGILRELTDAQAKSAVAALVNQEERDQPKAWRMGELGREGVERRMPRIVCFELPISRWQAKFKLHQDEWLADVGEIVPKLRTRGQDELADRIESHNVDRKTDA